MSFSQIPQELVDKLVDTVYYETPLDTHLIRRTTALKTLSLVCRAFVPRSQVHIFHKIHLDCVKYSYYDEKFYKERIRIQEFLDILKEHPQIASYVRDVRLTINLAHSDVSWISSDPALVHVMEALQSNNLRPIEFFSLNGRRKTYISSGDSPDNTFRDADVFITRISRHFLEPYLTYLRIESLGQIPIGLIERCIHLQNLSIDDISWEEGPLTTGSGPQIREFTFGYAADAVEMLAIRSAVAASYMTVNFSNLKIFTVKSDSPDDYAVAQYILNLCKQSLEILYIHQLMNDTISNVLYSHINFDRSELINLNGLSALHTLEIGLSIGFGDDEVDEDWLLGICSVLSTIPRENQLREIEISLTMNIDDEPFDNPFEWDTFVSEINRIFGRKERKALRFTLNLSYNYRQRYDSDRQPIPEYTDMVDQCREIRQELLNDTFFEINEDPLFHLAIGVQCSSWN